MKKPLLSLLLAMLSLGVYSQSSCFQGWQYSTPITIQNPNNQILDSIEVQLSINTSALISAGKMQANGSDIRFSLSDDCCTEIPYFIESGINTTNTAIWIRIPQLPANNSYEIFMLYGNPNASSNSNPETVFSVYEGFDSNSLTNFSPATCNSVFNITFNNGIGNLSWNARGLIVSNKTIYTNLRVKTEAQITGASGSWPGLYIHNSASAGTSPSRGYSTIYQGNQARLGVSGTNSTYCDGYNWASSLFTVPSPAGKWSLSWDNTGNLISEFPGMTTININHTTHQRSNQLKVMLGGVSSGTGSMQVDWVRAYKIPPTPLTYNLGTETNYIANAVSIVADTMYKCPGQTLTIDATPGFSSYQWSTGATTPSVVANFSGWYFVTAVNSSGCISKDSTFVVSPVLTPLYLGNDISMCQSGNVTLIAPPGYANYVWSTGETTPSIIVNTANIYICTASDQYGCSTSDTILVNYLPTISSDFTFWGDGYTHVQFNSNATNAANYLWTFDDGFSATLMNPSHFYNNPGVYNVCLTTTSQDGCTSTTCKTIDTQTLSTEGFSTLDFNIYPNPTNGFINIELNSAESNTTLQIIDVVGKIVMTEEFNNSGLKSIDVSSLPSGTYILYMKTDSKTGYKTFIKK